MNYDEIEQEFYKFKEYMDSYQNWVNSVANKDGLNKNSIDYPIVGLAAEAGEVLEIKQKKDRYGRDHWTEKELSYLKDELGDVLHYCARLANDLNVSIVDLLVYNIEKIEEKRKSNV